MALKGYLIVDPECSQICDDAIKAMKDQIGAQEVEVLEVAEAIRRGIDLGEPEGIPFVCIHSDTRQRCLTKMFFHDEEGKIIIQPYPTVHEPEKKTTEQPEQTVETEQG